MMSEWDLGLRVGINFGGMKYADAGWANTFTEGNYTLYH